jgi:regulatory protein
VVRRLVTAGFSTGVIYKILRQWDVPEESLAALENLEVGDAEETGSTE